MRGTSAGSGPIRTYLSTVWCLGRGRMSATATCLTLSLLLTSAACRAQTPVEDATPAGQPTAAADTAGDTPTEPSAPPAGKETARTPLEPEKDWLRVAKDYEVWIDIKQKQVIAGGHVCLREGLLEMFACPKQTKEHESIIAIHTPARFVHGALLALGAQPGPPVQFEPTYRPAQGTEVAVDVLWRDEHGQTQRVKAQEWVRHVKTGQALAYPWVFAGSGFWSDEEGKERFYYADGGEFICVSNFSTAMLDLPIESSAANETLLFTAYTERIPPRDTPVFLFLTPKLDAPESPAAEPAKPPATEPAKPAAADGEAEKSPAQEPAAPAPATEG